MQQGHENKGRVPREDGDDDIIRILRLAQDANPPLGAAERLMARIAREPQLVTSIKVMQRRDNWRLAALPLAASLLLGVYLGAQGRLDFILPAAITDGLAFSEDFSMDELGGMGEAEAVAGENLS